MTPSELSKLRTTHPAYWGAFLEELIARLRLNHATPCLTMAEMQGYISDLEMARQLLPLTDLLLAEAINYPVVIEDSAALAKAVTNAVQLQAFAQEVWS